MKNIFMICFLLPLLCAAQARVSIGERYSGQKVSIGYLEENPILKSEPGTIVKSYTISYSLNSSMQEIHQKGNNLLPFIPKLKLIPVNGKFFVEATVGLSDGRTTKVSINFTIEDYTFTDKIFIGPYANGDSIPFYSGFTDIIRYIDPNYEIVSYSLSFNAGEYLLQRNMKGNLLPFDVQLQNLNRNTKLFFDRIQVRHKIKKDDTFLCKAVFTVK